MALEQLFTVPAQQLGALVAETWLAMRRQSRYRDVPPPEPSLSLLGEVLLDRTFTLSTSVMTGLPLPEAVRRMLDEAEEARRLFEERGWLANPAAYHLTPPPLLDPEIREESTWAGPPGGASSAWSSRAATSRTPASPGASAGPCTRATAPPTPTCSSTRGSRARGSCACTASGWARRS